MASSTSLLLLVAFLCVVVDGGVMVPDTKIVGGQGIEISDMPWQVAIFYNGRFNCGGSIINRRWILTAAHCTYGEEKSKLEILIGTKSLKEGGSRYSVEDIVNHEEYDDDTARNDISIIKTTTDMDLDLPVKVVKLPDSGMKRPEVKTPLRVSGWGDIENDESPTLLRAVDIEVRDANECNYEIMGIIVETDESTQLCAGLSRKNSCVGDSGGPLMMGDVQVGVVSYMFSLSECGDYPSVYTYVPYYSDWIKAHTTLQ